MLPGNFPMRCFLGTKFKLYVFIVNMFPTHTSKNLKLFFVVYVCNV